MSRVKVTTIIFILTAAFFGLCMAQLGSYQERCELGTTADGRQLDTCDSQKFLKCRDSRCQCADPKNHIWTTAMVRVNSRSKRGKGGKGGGSKGGSFGKGVAAGAIGGAAGGYLGARLGSSSSSSSSYPSGGSWSRSSYSSSSSDNSRYTQVSSCYSRVGGSCRLSTTYGDNVVISVNTNRPEAWSPPPTPEGNATTTAAAAAAAPAPVPPAQTTQTLYDILSLSKCVDNAECRPAEIKIVNGTVVSGGFADPRIGACQCRDGYKANNRDTCLEVERSGSSRETQVGTVLTLMCFLVSYLGHN